MRKKYILLVITVLIMCIFMNACRSSNKKEISLLEENQSFWNDQPKMFTKGNNGYYYTCDNKLMYMDGQDGDYYPVCGKAECEHNSEMCDAFLDDTFMSQSIWYYNENIYLLKYNKYEKTVMLIKVNKDGTERKELCVIAKTNVQRNGEYGFVFHDNYAYMYSVLGQPTLQTDGKTAITKISLSDGKMEDIYSVEANKNQITSLKCYADKLMFVVVKRKQEGDKIVCETSEIYSYDCSDGKLEKFLNEPVCDYSLDMQSNTLYYYKLGDGLYKKELHSGKVTQIYQSEENTYMCQISFDGKNVYMTNQRMDTLGLFYQCYVWIISPEGEQVNKLAVSSTFFGDDQYLFAISNEEEITDKKIVALKKDNIRSVKDEDWIVLGNYFNLKMK